MPTAEIKTTPGPWKVDGGRGKHGDLYIWQNVKGIRPEHAIATVHEEMMEGAQGNARLIAAAPELLEALRAALAVIQKANAQSGISLDDAKVIIPCLAAIARAEGVQ